MHNPNRFGFTDQIKAGSGINVAQNALGYIISASGGGGGYDEGTSFPGSPSTDDKFYRTDLNLLYFYDGTRWLTVEQYVIELKPYSNTYVTAMSATTASRMVGTKPCPLATDFWVEDVYVAGSAGTTVSITNHWLLAFKSYPATGAATTLATININTDGWVLNQNSRSQAAVDALLGVTETLLTVDCTEVGTSTLLIFDAKLVGRLVGT